MTFANNMKTIEEVTIPLLAKIPPKCHKLVRWCVPDGVHVSVTEVIFELEVDGTVYEVESFYTGHIKQCVAENTIHQIGDVIAHMHVDADTGPHRTVGVTFTTQEMAVIDNLRGDLQRDLYIRQAICDRISQE